MFLVPPLVNGHTFSTTKIYAWIIRHSTLITAPCWICQPLKIYKQTTEQRTLHSKNIDGGGEKNEKNETRVQRKCNMTAQMMNEKKALELLEGCVRTSFPTSKPHHILQTFDQIKNIFCFWLITFRMVYAAFCVSCFLRCVLFLLHQLPSGTIKCDLNLHSPFLMTGNMERYSSISMYYTVNTHWMDGWSEAYSMGALASPFIVARVGIRTFE